jgi:hypothetical protein
MSTVVERLDSQRQPFTVPPSLAGAVPLPLRRSPCIPPHAVVGDG